MRTSYKFSSPLVGEADGLLDRLGLLEHAKHVMGDVGAWNRPAAPALVVHALYNLRHCPPFPFLFPFRRVLTLASEQDPRRLLNTSFFPRSYSLVFPGSGVGCRYSPRCREGIFPETALPAYKISGTPIASVLLR